MGNPTFFIQECPTCGRRLQIRVEHLGKSVVCQHCSARLTARDPATAGPLVHPLLCRADELLRTAARRIAERKR
jgi:hypothetical protein